jgi:hypothetical protein
MRGPAESGPALHSLEKEKRGRSSINEMSERKTVLHVKLDAVTLKLTLTPKFLAKPLHAAVLTPFLSAYHKKTKDVHVHRAIDRVTVDGAVVAHLNESMESGVLLTTDTHDVEIFLQPEELDISDWQQPGEGSSSSAPPPSATSTTDANSAVERVCAAPHEFAILELPLDTASSAAVRKAYRRISLNVHPDKVAHPRSSEAFRNVFDAMKLLIDPKRQAMRLQEIKSGGSGTATSASALPAETRWWDAASVAEMEQAFRNLEEFLEAQVTMRLCPRP